MLLNVGISNMWTVQKMTGNTIRTYPNCHYCDAELDPQYDYHCIMCDRAACDGCSQACSLCDDIITCSRWILEHEQTHVSNISH